MSPSRFETSQGPIRLSKIPGSGTIRLTRNSARSRRHGPLESLELAIGSTSRPSAAPGHGPVDATQSEQGMASSRNRRYVCHHLPRRRPGFRMHSASSRARQAEVSSFALDQTNREKVSSKATATFPIRRACCVHNRCEHRGLSSHGPLPFLSTKRRLE
jgi:hypothetical protein